MKSRIEIIKEFNKKINILKTHNKLYFTNDKPEIPDSEYDQIKKEVLELTKKFKFLDELAMKANLVGAPLSNKFKNKAFNSYAFSIKRIRLKRYE